MKVQRVAKGMAGTIAIPVGAALASGAAGAPVFDSLQDFLAWAMTSAGGGLVLWGLISFINSALPNGLDGTIKFYLALLLAFVIPVAAYDLAVQLHFLAWSINQLFLCIVAGYQVSQTIHREASVGAPSIAEPPPLSNP